jgi:hypothetical protein
MVIHVVLFKFKSGAEPAAIEAVKSALEDVSAKLPSVGRYLAGPNTSPEDFGQGYDWGFVMTFGDAASRDAYVVDPAHTAVHPLLDEVMEQVLVYDIGG